MIKSPLCAALAICVLTLTACASRPAIQGVPVVQMHQSEISSWQAEVIWQERSFAFLLSQSATDAGVQVLGLTLSGQVLFDVRYSDGRFMVVDKAPALQRLPVEFLVRDIWWASRPSADVAVALAPIGFDISDDAHTRQIRQADGKVRLSVTKDAGSLHIDNTHIGYRLILSDTDDEILQ